MILITQLAQYKVTAHQLGGVAVLHKAVKGASGHSQGISAAVVAACGHDDESFDKAAARMVRVAFHTGRRVQMLCGVVLAGEEGSDRQLPTPLMVVGNCSRGFLEKHAAAVNSTLPQQQHVELALFNGPLTTVVSGLPESLRTLRIALSLVQAKPGENQNRIPYIKRKPDLWYNRYLHLNNSLLTHIRTSYLSVSVPFHSKLLANAPADILADLLQSQGQAEGEEGWNKWELKFPVFSTLDGSNLQGKSALLLDLLSLQCNQPVHWAKAIQSALPANSVTHVFLLHTLI